MLSARPPPEGGAVPTGEPPAPKPGDSDPDG